MAYCLFVLDPICLASMVSVSATALAATPTSRSANLANESFDSGRNSLHCSLCYPWSYCAYHLNSSSFFCHHCMWYFTTMVHLLDHLSAFYQALFLCCSMRTTFLPRHAIRWWFAYYLGETPYEDPCIEFLLILFMFALFFFKFFKPLFCMS